jgi:hypothetical protein
MYRHHMLLQIRRWRPFGSSYPEPPIALLDSSNISYKKMVDKYSKCTKMSSVANILCQYHNCFPIDMFHHEEDSGTKFVSGYMFSFEKKYVIILFSVYFIGKSNNLLMIKARQPLFVPPRRVQKSNRWNRCFLNI